MIIGAGFAGLSAARRLSELHPGDCIVVVDATCVAEGPAGRNSGFMIDVPHDLSSSNYTGDVERNLREIRLNRAGIQYAMKAKRTYGMSDEAISPSGKINAAISSRGLAHNESYAKHLKSLNEPFEEFDELVMQELTGTNCYKGGVFNPGTVMLQPAQYVRCLAAGIEQQGVQIFENSPVVELLRANNLWKAKTRKGSIQAPKVILSVNGHLESFGYSKRRLMHIFTYGTLTRALTEKEVSLLGGVSNWALTPADPLGTSVRRVSGIGGDRILIRNTATYDPSLQVEENWLDSVARIHDRSFKFRFPQLKNVSMDYRWGGRLCLSRNNVSVFGEIDNNLFSACCQNGLGTAKGTTSGMLAAELASGMPSPLLDDQMADEEPQLLPPKPLASIGANALLRWNEYRAGKEL